MAKRTKKSSSLRPIVLVVLGLCSLAGLVSLLLRDTDVALVNPKGYVATEQYKLLVTVTVLLLEIAVPTLLLFYFVAWKYRESNHNATYAPDITHGKLFSAYLWIIPSITALLIAIVLWPATHQLQPQKPIYANTDPMVIQVVAMRWKWLFIYPEQNIATVNFVQVPIDTPLEFQLSADETPMSSFWIPHLGGQLYAMTGHVNRLNLIASETGDFTGSSAEINGPGFAGMRFTTRVSTANDFYQWVNTVKSSGETLDAKEYQELLEPSEYNEPVLYSRSEEDLYGNMLMKYTGSHDHHTESE
ncbi:MAG: COX aromatic rich motif-containing protein [Candidatus Saccharibacteria bacterium]|nr:COX aromatic rich motif-containing protein [Candidatus Saccharibacteria bacterium]